jgi:NAD(P)-dependent dehydrogenase (short-subunit alcohol dehydrogenase family)
MKEFEGRVAVITGGASGIGRAMADRFAAAGMKIVIADIEEEALRNAERQMRDAGATLLGVVSDVSDAVQVNALAQKTIDTFGAVHVVCNNAGVASKGGPTWEQSEADWDWVLRVNLRGVIHGIRTFVPIMLQQGGEGHVVNTASFAGLYAGPFMGPYNASKFAVVAITETLYYELKAIQSPVSASVLCPGGVRTRITESARNRPSDIGEETSGPVTTAIGEVAMQRIRDIVENGIDPARVADRVFEAVRDEQLYIFTHPEYADMVSWRTENIIGERKPDLSVAFGMPQPGAEAAA